ncbi:MAG: hypothetical protein LUE93_04065 [Bacteroides sp.]|nr:hypothetical protein [Bacteroides sp.]
MINQIDRKLIFPSRQEISSSANGIDLLGNMQLSGIEVNPIKNTIEGSRGGSVNLRINGAPATLKEIQAINPKDVIRIEHHDEPSLRYAGAEAVIDYIVRKRESGGSVMTEARHSLDPTMSDYFASGKFNYNKSKISLAYGYGESRSKKGYYTSEENFLFEDGSTLTRIEEGLPGRYRSYGHDAKIGYSYQEPDKNLFNANFNYSNNRTPYYNSESLLYAAGDKASAVNMTQHSQYSTQSPSLDLYYQHTMKNKQFIALNVVGTYQDAHSDRVYRESLTGVNFTAIDTYIDLDKYSMIGEVIYEKSFNAGRLSSGIKYNHSFANLTYTGTTEEKVKTRQNITYAYTEWMGKADKLTYALGLGVTRTGVYQDETDHNEVRFTPSLLLSYDFSRALQVRLRTETVTTEAPLSELYDVDQIIDSLYIRRGNPHLKAQMTYVNRFSLSYNKNRVRFSFNMQHRYMTDPIMRSTLREDNKFILMMENHKRWHQVRTSATLNLKLFKDYLSWTGDLGHNWIQSTGNDFNHLMRNFYIITSLRGNYKSWNSFFQLENRRNHLTNEALYYGRHDHRRYRLPLQGPDGAWYVQHLLRQLPFRKRQLQPVCLCQSTYLRTRTEEFPDSECQLELRVRPQV